MLTSALISAPGKLRQEDCDEDSMCKNEENIMKRDQAILKIEFGEMRNCC